MSKCQFYQEINHCIVVPVLGFNCGVMLYPNPVKYDITVFICAAIGGFVIVPAYVCQYKFGIVPNVLDGVRFPGVSP